MFNANFVAIRVYLKSARIMCASEGSDEALRLQIRWCHKRSS